MSLFWIIFPVVVFIIVLSFTDMKEHVKYSFKVAIEEGVFRFPIIWLLSFAIPSEFVKITNGSYDYDRISRVERALRSALSGKSKYEYNARSGLYEITGLDENSRLVYFTLPNRDDDHTTVRILGSEILVPPRIAILMLKLADKADVEYRRNKKKKTSIID